MATINTGNGTFKKAAAGGYLWYVDLEDAATVDPNPLVALPAGAKFVGEVSPEGVQQADNPEEAEAVKGKTGSVWYQPAATKAPTITFTHWEVYNSNAIELHIHPDDVVKAGGEALGWDEIASAKDPKPKVFIVETETNDGTPERVVYWNTTFTSREPVGGDGEAPFGFTTTYTVKVGEGNKLVSVRRASATSV